MIFSPTVLSTTVDEARKHLEIQGRESDTPIRFELQVSYTTGEQDAQRLCADVSPIPTWGWPVLDNEASVTALKSALKELSTKGELTELALVALQDGYAPHTVMDFFNCEIAPSEPTQPPLIFCWKITNMVTPKRGLSLSPPSMSSYSPTTGSINIINTPWMGPAQSFGLARWSTITPHLLPQI